MSIFRSTFPEHVKNQLAARQFALTKQSRSSQNLSYINSRNAWVRMSSSVNVDNSNELAKRYILQGGTLNADGTKKTGLGSSFQNAYSNVSQNNQAYRLGIRPMPGITGVEIKSKTAYGSLREAIVSFQCWDIQQLEDLEVLYMRPGYTVLLEWGWAPYITSTSPTYHPTFNDYYDIINKTPTDRTKLFKDLFDKSKKYEGNYDAMFGYVKNYQWSARADGGYDCQTTIITTGEIIESLKINYTRIDKVDSVEKGLLNDEFTTLPVNTEWFRAYEKNKLAGMWAELYYRMAGEGETAYNYKYQFLKTTNSYLSSTIDDANSLTKNGTQIYIPLSTVFIYLNKYIIAKSSADQQPLVKLSLKYKDPSTGKEDDLLCIAHPLQLSVDPGVCLIKNPLWTGDTIKVIQEVPNNDPVYIRSKEAFELIKIGYKTKMGLFVYSLSNKLAADSIVTGVSLINSTEVYNTVNTLIKEEGDYEDLQAVLRGEMGLTNGFQMRQIKEILSKLQFDVKFNDYNTGIDVDSDTIEIITPPNFDKNSGASSQVIIEEKSTEAFGNLKTLDKLRLEYFADGDPYSEIGVLKHIYVNVDYLYVNSLNAALQAADDKGKEEINLYNYVKTLMQDIQTSIGNVNSFEIHVDPIDNNVARVIDINYTEKTKVRYQDLFPLSIHELNSTVRSYSLQSQIFPNQSSIIAIGSQVKGGAVGIQSNTMIDFNRNITDRVLPGKVDGSLLTPTLDTGSVTSNITNGLAPIINAFSLDNVQIDPSGNPSYDDEIAAAKTGLKDVIVYFQSIVKSPGSNRNLIPTKFSCEIDGIGGLIIGNMFRLPKHVLPKGYRGQGAGVELGNAVTGIAHTIGKGDWVTKIDSLNIVLDDPLTPNIKITKELLGSLLQTGLPDQATQDAINAASASSNASFAGTGGGSANAMLQATDAVYGSKNGQKSVCGRYTYNIARNYILASQGKTGQMTYANSVYNKLIPAGGNANDAGYRNSLKALGYTEQKLGVITRDALVNLLRTTNWKIGDIINYRNLGSDGSPGSKQIGHTQIYTGGIQARGNGVKWTSSIPDNYGTDIVYSANGPWEVYVFSSNFGSNTTIPFAPSTTPSPASPSPSLRNPFGL
jgi:hypothetical protein